MVFVVGSFVLACSDTSKDGEVTSATGATSGAGGGDPGGGGQGGVSSGGCASPPPDDFDPLATYPGPGLVADLVVTSTSDAGEGSLRALVASASEGQIIGFDASLAGRTIELAQRIEIGGSITIDGSGAPGLVIDAQQNDGAFHFNGDQQTRLGFFSLTITHGNTLESGGAISVNGAQLDIDIGGVRFLDNSAGEGGAVRIGYRTARSEIHDCFFQGNDGSLTNNGFSGGAISQSGGHLHVARCRFEGNVGSVSGAVYSIHADPVIEDSVFVDNRSAGDHGSGAFFTDGGGPGDYGNGDTTPGEITLRRTRFASNRGAGDDGGACELYAYPPDEITVEGCVFQGNQSSPGRAGALFIHADNTVNVRATAFVDNHATQTGGAIWADGSAVYTFENVLFSGNVGDDDFGGALRLNLPEEAKLRLSSVTLVDNQARDGNGALWLPGMRDVRVTNTIVANNTGSPGAQQINFAVANDGGNFEWPPSGATISTLDGAESADPLLGAIVADLGTWVRPPQPGSPVIGAAVAPSPARDQRGALRDSSPDAGSYELDGVCGR